MREACTRDPRRRTWRHAIGERLKKIFERRSSTKLFSALLRAALEDTVFVMCTDSDTLLKRSPLATALTRAGTQETSENPIGVGQHRLNIFVVEINFSQIG